ncbi:hypothetical protein BDB00DRAFT_870513 [Zychaea mexicana]|uniref:uncharacterized protein n=1 Tax=Zychaea mexicana TaxID=64656 RepID=UPI0022FE48BB|nr:uncharacterized protein BDB00DRAFT_870513 [Zychaea mexicana]KAI9495362.1 hypothetical protein BDB00DRAFT_870513 [Zychaea mexicana]
MVVHVGTRLVRSSNRFVIQILLDYNLPPEVELGCLMTCEIYGNQLDSCRTIANRDRGIDVGTKADAGSTPLAEIALFVRRNSRPEYNRRYAKNLGWCYILVDCRSMAQILKSTGFCRQGTSIKPKTEFSIPPSGNDSLEHPGFASKKPGSSQRRNSPFLQAEMIPLNTPVSPPRNQDQAKDGILHSSRKIFPSRQRLAVTITGTTRQKKDNPSFRNPQSKGKGMNGDLHGTLNYNRWEIQNMKSNGDSEDGTAGGGEGNTALVARVLQEHHPHELELTEDNLEKE